MLFNINIFYDNQKSNGLSLFIESYSESLTGSFFWGAASY